ncbi:hypothetical protein GCM10009868_16080 [Terrabacter aerolatus]|uniref:Polysaccharide chain length determinant N-terminal domain-containing protein n=1 Tax=Terrabacter aerolatus TaxID=422442 RepID=A0A512D4A9_9MICO|nr:hypothetical protein [Terrabacter aerolatus]GEO31090.1 hypothetical protein TAE01_29000 [Terrabacter aerolatus]
MDAFDVLKVCLRRWYVGVPIVLLAAVVGVGLSQDRTVEYSGSSSIALIYEASPASKASPDSPISRNPLAGNGGSLLYEAVLADLNSPRTQLELAGDTTSGVPQTEASNGSRFSAYVVPDKQSITVTAYGTDAKAVRATVDRVIAATAKKTTEIQDRAGVPRDGQFTTFLTIGTELSMLPPASASKLIAAVVGVGILAAAALSILVDRLMTRRRKSRKPASRHAATAADAEGIPTGNASAPSVTDPQDETPQPAPIVATAPSNVAEVAEPTEPTEPTGAGGDDIWETASAASGGSSRT